jgi:hypothetical protein
MAIIPDTEFSMKIGIITFHFGSNYGAILQTYALCHAVESQGHTVEIIDFIPKRYANKTCIAEIIRNRIVKIINFKNDHIKRERIAAFREHNIKLTSRRYDTIEDINNNPPSFDAYICGSDQIWNPDLFGVLPPYFLDFVPDGKAIKLSYAASFGRESLPPINKYLIGQYLRGIQYISVREQTGINIVRDVAGREATQAMDPVFLIPPHEWETLISYPFCGLSQFILLYTMAPSHQLLQSARYLSERFHMPVIHLSWGIKKHKGIDHVINTAGPLQFIELIKHASYICTNSFHGTAFSIIFNKPFLVTPLLGEFESRNTRILSLLDKLGLTGQMVCDDKSLYKLAARNLAYNSNITTELLNDAIDNSFAFLKTSLRSI